MLDENEKTGKKSIQKSIIKTDYITITKRIFAIAIPIMLSNLISQVQMLIDRIFIGKLDITAMSAVSNATSPMWTTMDVVYTLSVGSAILMSQEVGRGDEKKAREYLAALFKYANVFSILLFLSWCFFARQIFQLMGAADSIIDMSVSYARYYSPVFLLIGVGSAISTMLQVSERTKVLVFYGVIRSLANIFLDYGLVFGHFGLPRMEVAGAALATTIAELLGDLVIILYVVTRKDIAMKPGLKEIVKAKLKPYLISLKMGLPSAVENFMWNAGSLYLIVMLNQIGDRAAGVYSISFGVELLPVCIIGAIGTAVLTLAGKETGKKNYKGVGEIARTGIYYCFGIAIVIFVLFILFPHQIISWFTKDADVIRESALYLFIVGIDLFPKSLNIQVGSAIKGYGDTKWMLFTQVIGTVFVIGTSSILILVLHLGIASLFALVVADETLRCGINIARLVKISRQK